MMKILKTKRLPLGPASAAWHRDTRHISIICALPRKISTPIPHMSLSRRSGNDIPSPAKPTLLNPGVKRDHMSPDSASKFKLMASSSAGSDAAFTGKAGLLPVLFAVAVASCGAFAFGYHLGVLNGPLERIAADLGFEGNANLQGLVISSSLAGAAVGSLGGSGLADALGRRKAFFLDCVPLLLGALLCSTATGSSSIILGRAIIGLGIGLSSALVPLYISEIAPTNLRGALGSINQLMICIGILAALIVNVFIPASSWRAMFVLSALPATLLAVGMAFCPESPSWLSLQGESHAAEAVATKLWGEGGASQLGHTGVSEMLQSRERSPSWADAFQSKGAKIGVVMFLLQQFSGINAIVYFSSSVFASAGISSGALASAAVGLINVIGTVGAASLMDRAGRKELLRLSFSGMGLCMFAMALGLALPSLAPISGSIALFGTLAYVLCFAAGAGPVPGLLVPEITGDRIRGTAVALAMGSHWVCNFFVGQLFLPAVSAFGVAGVYMFFAFVCLLAVAFVNSQVVETKGKSLKEIEAAMMT
jgi:sugar porter (SP) family MFS transporter